MFDRTSTPEGFCVGSLESSGGGGWERYMSNGGADLNTPTSTHSTTSTIPIPIDPALLSTPTPTKNSAPSTFYSPSTTTTKSHHRSSHSISLPYQQQLRRQQAAGLQSQSHSAVVLSSSHPASSQHYASSATTLSPSLSASPHYERDELRTPTIRSAYPPPPFTPFALPQHQPLPSTAVQHFTPLPPAASPNHSAPMPYPTTPSPQQSYGVSGMMISEPQIMPVANEPSCTPMHPSHADVFIAQPATKARPVLRPTLSHNGVYPTPAPAFATWPRRVHTSVELHARAGTSHSHSSHSGVDHEGPHTTDSHIFAAPPPPILEEKSASTIGGGGGVGGGMVGQGGQRRSGPSGISILRVSASSVPPNTTPAASVDQSLTSTTHAHGQNGTVASSQGHQSAAQGFSSSLSLPSLATAVPSYAAPAPPPPPPPPPPRPTSSNPSSLPTSYSHHTITQEPAGTYGDDLAHSTSFSPTYEALQPTYSPWPAHSSLPTSTDHLGRPVLYYPSAPPGPPYYMPSLPAKMEEPILAPGELPVPRPPISYAALIGEALLLAPAPHQLYVSEISESVKRRYAYYRQNPSKIYNGVRHQTSMCKAFVKLSRPFGDQSGGARKWAIRAGCESWFHSGGYHPPGGPNSSPIQSSGSLKKSHSTSASAVMGGKAKATARAKQLAIGVTTPESKARKVDYEPFSPSSGQGGPSLGPAFDGTGRPTWVSTPAPPPIQSHASAAHYHPFYAPAPAHAHAHAHAQTPASAPTAAPISGGYHYVPIPPQYHHAQQHQAMYVPVYGHYPHGQPQQGQMHASPSQHFMPTPISQAGPEHGESSPEWRYEQHDGEGMGDEGQNGSPSSSAGRHSPNQPSPATM